MKCPICGTEAKPGSHFCKNCGQPLPLTPTESPKKSNKARIIIPVVAVILIAAIAAVSVFLFFRNKTDPIAEENTGRNTLNVDITETTDSETTVPDTTAPETTVPDITVQVTVPQTQTVPTFSYNDQTQQNNANQYLFDSANKKITFEYLKGCTRDEITIIINEIYARHGYIFKDAELREYFNSQSWYSGTTASMEDAASRFNATEKENVNTIYAYQKQMGWR